MTCATAKKYCQYAALIIFILCILYPAFSISYHALSDSENITERLPYAVGAIVLALGGGLLYAHYARPNTWHSYPFALWCGLGLGLLSNLLMPCQEHNTQGFILACVIIASATVFIVCTMRAWSLCVIVPFLVLLSILTYLRIGLDVTDYSGIIGEIIGFSPQDAMQFITFSNVMYVILVMLIITGMAYILIKAINSNQRALLVLCSAMIFTSSMLVAKVSDYQLLSKEPQRSIGIIGAAYRVVNDYKLFQLKHSRLYSLVENLPSPANKPSTISTLKGSEGVVVILHVGESVRADHLIMNGYNRNTTPWLSACKDLINFQNCTAASDSTTASALAILTNARGNVKREISPELRPTTGCIMDLFAANHFECYGFFNSTAKGSKEMWDAEFEVVQDVFTARAKKVYDLEDADNFDPMAQLPQIAEALSDGTGNKFFLVNNMGSHLPFNHYDAAHAHFQPADGTLMFKSPQNNPGYAEKIVNAYDNTIAYTDSYIEQLISMLKGKSYIYIYVSDHGEPLGDGQKWNRAELAPVFHQCQWSKVGFFILCSPELEAQHPHIAEAVSHLRKNKDMPVAHENIFHTLLGLFGIQTPYYDASLDLSSPAPRPYQGPSCDRNGESLDNLKWE